MASIIPQFVRENMLFSATVAALATSTTLPFLSFVYSNIRSSGLPTYRHGSESWALVTGASDGIGYGFVTELADQGFNVILHGRNESKLDGLTVKLQQTYPARKFRILVVSASDRSAWHKLDEFAASLLKEKLKLTVLVNNVGGGGGGVRSFSPLQDQTLEAVNSFIDISATFPVQITRSLLPVLKANQPSLILNVGSIASIATIPYLGVYCGAKAFDTAWSQSLHLEMKAEEKDIEVLLVLVGKVQTAGTNMIDLSFFIPSSKQLASSALQKVGYGRDVVTAYWRHSLQLWLLLNLPTWMKQKAFIDMSKEEMRLETEETKRLEEKKA